MKMQAYSTSLYRQLGDEVGYPMNYHVTGAIRLAHTSERMRELSHVVSMARRQGMQFEMLSPTEIRDRYPFIELHDLEGGSWDPLDGDIDPAQLSQALAAGARQMGAKIIRFCPVTGVRRENGEWVIATESGDIRAEYVVNAAGYRAQEVGRWFNREIPQVTLAHQYLITEPVPELQARPKRLPLLRDPDVSYYLRQEKHGLLLGPYERGCKAHWMTPDDRMPSDFSFQLYPDDLERIEPYIEDACARVPLLGSVGLTRVVNGPIPYTPDGNPLIGPMPGVPNAFEACVFTFGIVQGGGAGKILAEWIVEGAPEWDMWSCDPRRFTSFADQDYASAKGIEVYSHEYAIHFPHYQWPEGREKRLSPLYDRLKAKGAQFMAAAGWERAAWFARPGDDTSLAACETFGRQGPWYEAVRDECLAVRDAAGICEMAGFSRLQVRGAGVAHWLNGLVTGTVPKVGRIGLVYFTDAKGRVLTEMTAARRGEDDILLLTAAGAEWHDREWLEKHLPEGSPIAIANVTDDEDAILLTGPKARDILAPLTADLGLPWLAHQQTTVAGQVVRLIRVSYVGELGWELHAPNSAMPAIYDALIAAGEPHGLRHFGMYAMNSLRLEKSYRAWKQDLSTDFTPWESGLDRFVRMDKADFIGKQALACQLEKGIAQRFTVLTVDAEDCDAPNLSSVWNGDKPVGLVTSGGYGHRTDRSIALTMIEKDCTQPGTALEVEIFGARVPATVRGEAPLYDPENLRLRN